MSRRHQEKHRLALAALVLLGSAGTACSQTSASLTLVSAYTARGVALDTRPTPQLRIERDVADGWYAGGFVSPVRLYARSQAQVMAYGGRALRITPTMTFDAGISRSTFSRDARLDFSEAYVGLMQGRTSARLFYSPHYYGEGRTVYLDLNTAYPLTEQLSLALHAGVLHPFGEYGRYHAREPDAGDVRIGLSRTIGDYRVQLGWQATWHPYLQAAGSAPALTASASRYF
jgi:uncharacterized protein (TIGR02001 family)